MPFPIEEEHIVETEKELGVVFPTIFKEKMKLVNGGQVKNAKYELELFPFLNRSSKETLRRTAVGNITNETRSAKSWLGFPSEAIVIGHDGYGNKVVLMKKQSGEILEKIYLLDHEIGSINLLAKDIKDLEK